MAAHNIYSEVLLQVVTSKYYKNTIDILQIKKLRYISYLLLSKSFSRSWESFDNRSGEFSANMFDFLYQIRGY